MGTPGRAEVTKSFSCGLPGSNGGVGDKMSWSWGRGTAPAQIGLETFAPGSNSCCSFRKGSGSPV